MDAASGPTEPDDISVIDLGRYPARLRLLARPQLLDRVGAREEDLCMVLACEAREHDLRGGSNRPDVRAGSGARAVRRGTAQRVLREPVCRSHAVVPSRARRAHCVTAEPG